MATTIKEVARRAGVSIATVSYVLNNKPGAVRISEATRRRIREAVRELGYHPNALARALAGKRTHTIALVMQYASIFSNWSGFTSEMMHGIVMAAVAADLDLMLHTRERPDPEAEAQALADGRVDGALLLRDWDDPLIDLLVEQGIPSVLVFSRSRRSEVPYACCDDQLGGQTATEYLIGLGHKRILHLAGSPASSAALDRRRGYESALRAHGIEPDATLVLPMYHGGAPFDAVAQALRREPRPTAAFAWSDDAALRLIAEARSMALRVPTDLSVIGYDSTEVCNHTSPTLTSVSQDIPGIAARGVAMLAALMLNDAPGKSDSLVSPELCVRESCAPAPTSGGSDREN